MEGDLIKKQDEDKLMHKLEMYVSKHSKKEKYMKKANKEKQ